MATTPIADTLFDGDRVLVDWSHAPTGIRRVDPVNLWHARQGGHSDPAGIRRILAIRFLSGGLAQSDEIRIHAATELPSSVAPPAVTK